MNAATKELVASLLTTEPVVLPTPDIGDVQVTIEMLQDLGAR